MARRFALLFFLCVVYGRAKFKVFAFQVVELDLGSIVPSLSGPKRPHDRVPVSTMKEDFQSCLVSPVSCCVTMTSRPVPNDASNIHCCMLLKPRCANENTYKSV